jgi:hypothetical protein
MKKPALQNISIPVLPQPSIAFKLLVLSALVFSLSACQRQSESAVSSTAAAASTPASTAQHPALPTLASLQELMQLIDSSADPIWESVSTTITKKGIEEKQPRTEDEWKEVRLHALRLVELSNILQITSRVISHPGEKLEDHHVEGIFKPDDVRAAIDRNPAAFVQAAQTLNRASVENLEAIKARDINRMVKAGETLDKACEACHAVYWYPNDKTPWPAPFTAATRKSLGGLPNTASNPVPTPVSK